MTNLKFHSEKYLEYINSIEGFEVRTELGRDKGKGFDEFLKMGREVSFEGDIWKGFDEVLEIGNKIKKENGNLKQRMKDVSIKEVLKIFVVKCERQLELLPKIDFIEWLRETEDFYRKYRGDKVNEINKELEKSKGERTKKLKLRRNEYIEMSAHFCKIIEFVREDILNGANTASIRPPEKKGAKPLLSYKWESNPEKELPELYNKMKGTLIDSNTTLEQFTAIFTGKPIHEIGKVNWIANKNLLAYFIDTAYSYDKFPMVTEIWATAKHCFKDAANLRQAKDLYLNTNLGKPRRHIKIDILF